MKRYQQKPCSGEPPYIIAHRGISEKAPENTLVSFEMAANVAGVDMIELDVRLTKDEEVIVLHDQTLQRTSTGNGYARKYTLKEIQHFDAGSWFHPAFSKSRIPTLAEVFKKVGKRLWIDVEIKSDWMHKEPPGLIEEKVLDVVNSCDMDDRVLFSSFNHKLLANIKRKKPSAITGVLYNFYNNVGRLPSKLAERVGADVFVCAKHELTHRMVDDAHAHGIAVYVYTLNSINDAKKMLSFDVDGIMSNCADDLIDSVREFRNHR